MSIKKMSTPSNGWEDQSGKIGELERQNGMEIK
jgi:hypothetical protein